MIKVRIERDSATCKKLLKLVDFTDEEEGHVHYAFRDGIRVERTYDGFEPMEFGDTREARRFCGRIGYDIVEPAVGAMVPG